jgi:hypothetical protein
MTDWMTRHGVIPLLLHYVLVGTWVFVSVNLFIVLSRGMQGYYRSRKNAKLLILKVHNSWVNKHA